MILLHHEIVYMNVWKTESEVSGLLRFPYGIVGGERKI